MTQEEKQLLLKDLCARLLYDVCAHIRYNTGEPCYGKLTLQDIQWFIDSKIVTIKPYLRPMSSMTEEEMKKCRIERGRDLAGECGCESDYLNSIHIDYRGLIEKGLALEAPKRLYKQFGYE